MGLELFSPDDDRSAVVTAIRVPDGVDGAAVVRALRERSGITIAGGQGPLRGKIVRIGHIGYVGLDDVVAALGGARARARRSSASPSSAASPQHPRAMRSTQGVHADRVTAATVRACSYVSGSPRPASSCCGSVSTSTWTSTATSPRGSATTTRSSCAARPSVDGRADRASRPPQGDRPRRRGRRQRRPRRGDAARHPRRQRAAVHGRLGGRAHDRAAARARALDPAGARRAATRAAGSARASRGLELADKTLGLVGFGRIGQQVARRARGLEMHVVAYDPYVAPERFRELGVERGREPRGAARRRPTSSPCTSTLTPETQRADRARGARRARRTASAS